MAEDSRCQNCGNAGHFTVVVQNPRVLDNDRRPLLWCRNACSRLCAEILARRGTSELDAASGWAALSSWEIRPQLTPGSV